MLTSNFLFYLHMVVLFTVSAIAYFLLFSRKMYSRDYSPWLILLVLLCKYFVFITGFTVENTERKQVLYYWDDSIRYFQGAEYVKTHLFSGDFSYSEFLQVNPVKNGEVFCFIHGTFAYFLDVTPSTTSAFILNLLFSTLSIVVMIRVMRLLNVEVWVQNAFVLFFSLNPCGILFGISFLKESIIIMESVLFCYFSILFIKKKYHAAFGMFFTSFLIIFDRVWVLAFYLVPFALIMFISFVIMNKTKLHILFTEYFRIRVKEKYAFISLFAFLFLITIYVVNKIFPFWRMAEYLITYSSDVGGGFINKLGIVGKLAFTPILLLKFLLAPFPNIWFELSSVSIAKHSSWILSSLFLALPFHVLTASFMIIGTWAIFKKKSLENKYIIFSYMIIPSLLVATIISPNHFRIRESVFPFSYISAAYGFQYLKNKFHSNQMFIGLCLFTIFSAYLGSVFILKIH